MTEKLKKKAVFILIDTAYWIITLGVLLVTIFVVMGFLSWEQWAFMILWELRWLLLRIVIALSLFLALLGGWTSDYLG